MSQKHPESKDRSFLIFEKIILNIKDSFNMSRGYLVQAPTGSGKTSWIKNLDKNSNWLDGDEILQSEGIKNRNYFWYDDSKKSERLLIEGKFEEYLNKGFNIMYSGNPLLMRTSFIVLPDSNIRWNRLQNRKTIDYCPSLSQFEREEIAYKEGIKNCKHVRGDIPLIDELERMLK